MVSQENLKSLESVWKVSYVAVAIIGVFTILMSLIFSSSAERFLGYEAIFLTIIGVLYVVLAYFIWKKSFVASLISTVLVGIEAAFAFSLIKFSTAVLLVVATFYLWTTRKK